MVKDANCLKERDNKSAQFCYCVCEIERAKYVYAHLPTIMQIYVQHSLRGFLLLNFGRYNFLIFDVMGWRSSLNSIQAEGNMRIKEGEKELLGIVKNCANTKYIELEIII